MRKKYDWQEDVAKFIFGCCGYVYEEKLGTKYYEREGLKGEEEFIELGTTTKKCNDYYDRVEETRLYACPKCGTVQIEL